MTKILVTGASGFVGKRLCQVLRSAGGDVVAVYRRAIADAGPAAVVGDMNAGTDWRAALAGIDVVVHLAARVHVMNDQAADPLAAFRETNVAATLNLARQAVAAGVKRFVFVSSVKVNGEETHERAFTEADAPMPLDPYGVSKYEAELALTELAASSGLELVIVRPPLVYGPGVRANFQRLMQLAKTGLPVPFGAVINRRSLVAIDNLVDFLITCTTHPHAAGETFLVSDGRDVSINELHRMLAAAMGKRVMSVPIPVGWMAGAAALLGKTDAVTRLLGSLQVDIGHARATLGWRPVVTMEQAVMGTVAEFLA